MWNWSNLDLNWSERCIIMATNVAARDRTLSITDTKLYVPVVILLTNDNADLFEQLKSGLNRIINWKKYQSNINRKTKSVFRLLNWSYFSRGK